MKTIFLFPILFLIFGVAEHKTAVLEDCDEDEAAPRGSIHQTHRKSQIVLPKQLFQARPREQSYRQRPPQQEQLYKRQFMQPVQRSMATMSAQPQQFQVEKRRPPSQAQQFSRRQQRPVIWSPKPKPVNLIIKQPKLLDTSAKRKVSEYYPIVPFQKQKRIKLIPAFDEYETYPETDYVHEIVLPEARRFDYVEVENPAVPCDHDDSNQSTEVQDNNEINAREMNDSQDKDDEIVNVEKPNESEVQTEKEMDVTTPPTVLETTPIIETRNGNIPISANPEAFTNITELLLRGLLALISCLKSKTPMVEDMVSNILKAAISSCGTPTS